MHSRGKIEKYVKRFPRSCNTFSHKFKLFFISLNSRSHRPQRAWCGYLWADHKWSDCICMPFPWWVVLMWNCESKNFNEANSHLTRICRLIKYWHREGETAASVGRERKSMRLIINKMRRWKLPKPPSLKVSKQFVQSVPRLFTLKNNTKHNHIVEIMELFQNSFNKKMQLKSFFVRTNGKFSPRRHRWKT